MTRILICEDDNAISDLLLRVFTKNMLYQLIWGYDDSSDENVINIHVSNLRKKLRAHSDHDYIKTIWGLGLRFQDKS